MSGGSERSLKVLLFLGVSAAAAVALQQVLRWISDSSSNDSKAIADEDVIEVKSKIKIRDQGQKHINIDLEEVKTRPKIVNGNSEFTDYKMSVAMAPSKDEVNEAQTKISRAPAVEKQSLKSNHCWSELIEEDISQMKVADLKRELKLRGLAVTGKKEELVERLQLAVMPVDDTSINVGPGDEDDDLLAQANALLEDDPVSSTEKKMLNRDAEQIQKKVSIKRNTIQAPSETNISNLDKAGTQQQNQKNETPNNDKITAPNSNIDSSGLKTNESNGKQDQTNKDSTPVKMSDAEKAKSRAERFGVITTPNIDEKKSARAARFGITNTSKKIGESPAVDLEILKRRAERFGQSSSTALQKLELQEKIKERESRFGKVQNLATEPKRARVTAPNENLLTDEKMKKRAERFGIKA